MINRIATTVIAAAALGLAAFAGSATANATGVDDTFLDNIHKAGIVFDSNKAAFDDGQLVCKQLASGLTGVQVANHVLDDTDLTTHQAAVFVVESTYAYCPGYTDRLSPS